MANVHAVEFGREEPPTTAPHNLEVEQALLGCVLYDNAALERVPDGLQASHFWEPFHARLWAAMVEMVQAGRLAEPITVVDRFRGDAAFAELGGVRYLADLVDRAPPAANAADYARLVQDLALRRELIRIGGDMAKAAAEEESSARDLVEQAETALYSAVERGQGASGVRAFSEVLARAVDAAALAYDRDGGLSGLPTGLVDLDKMLGGLHASDLIVLAARPGMGKSALAGNIAGHLARRYAWEEMPDGKRRTAAGGIVLLFSLEMSGEQFATRIVAEVSGISSDRIRKGQIEASEFGRFRDAAVEIAGAPLHIDDTGGLPIAKLCSIARRQKRTTGLDLVIVDYLQLVTTSNRKGEGRVQEVTEVTQALKALAKELDIPVLALSQLSRQVENRDDKRPRLSDLRESGSIEQDADVVAFIYREALYLAQSEPREGSSEHLEWQERLQACRHEAEIIIGKQRHGPIGTVRLAFNEDLTQFSNLAREGRFNFDRAQPKPPAERRVVYSGVKDD